MDLVRGGQLTLLRASNVFWTLLQLSVPQTQHILEPFVDSSVELVVVYLDHLPGDTQFIVSVGFVSMCGVCTFTTKHTLPSVELAQLGLTYTFKSLVKVVLLTFAGRLSREQLNSA